MLDPARYARQLALPGFGPAELAALGSARVLVIGAGGLGSVVLPQLVGSGVGAGPGGCIGIVDDDVVERSNLHRQTLHGEGDLGRRKVDSAAERLAALNAGTTIVRHPERFSRETALALLDGYDLLVDGSDGFATRYLAADAAVLAGVPLVWGAVLQYDGQVGVSPVGGPGYRDLFPVAPDPASVLDCATGGVLPSVCGVIGSIMAAQVVTLLTGIGESLIGRVTTYDARSGRFRELAYRHDPSAVPVTALADEAANGGAEGAAPDHGVAERTVDGDELTAPQLAAMLAVPAPPLLLDVREPWEHELAAIAGSQLLPLGRLADGIGALPRDRRIVAYCHHGIRSRHALDALQAAGLDAQHLIGGIDAWSVQVDPGIARY
ncbi:ThiF family adenylyltransferase [Microcella sp.]|uniref:ThiF family adenylyltransferase n=1 Tax=Microcella sp. TaxID=1913979 RepID=UPI00391BC917